MTSNFPGGSPAGDGGPSGFLNNILTAASFGLALHYTQIQKSWQSCGLNTFCKAEKVILYMLAIFGVSSPSVLLSQIVKNYANQIAISSNGNPLFDNNSFWGPTVISMGIYTALEYYMSSWWEWVNYASECLRLGICENDDILVWIHNMKIRYCKKTHVDADIELDCVDGECIMEGKPENLTTEIKDPSDWCVVFFNELPLLVSAAIIAMFYILSSGVDFQSAMSTPTGHDGQPETSSGTETTEAGKTEGEDKSGKGEKTGSDKSESTEKGEKIDDKNTPTQPTSSNKTGVGMGKGNLNKEGPFMTQKIQVTCPVCKKSKSAHIPKPLPMYCENCGNNLASNKGPTVSTTPTPVSGNLAGSYNPSNRYSRSTSTFFKNPYSTVLREDKLNASASVVYWLNQCAAPTKDCNTLYPSHSENEYDTDNVDDDELYREYKAEAEKVLRDIRPCSGNSEQLNAKDSGNKQEDKRSESRGSQNSVNISREQFDDWEQQVERENASDYA